MNLSKTKRTIGVFLVLLSFSISVSVFAQNNSSTTQGVFDDSDQDGLSNDEELMYGTDVNNEDTDGDGYMDGVEVSSGYDPLKPAPGDKIVNSPEAGEKKGNINGEGKVNFTQEIAQKIIGVAGSGDIQDQQITLEDIEEIIQGAIGGSVTLEDLPEIDESQIKIKKQNYSHFSEEKQEKKKKEDAEEYVAAISYLMIENSPYKITKPEDLEGFEDEIVGKISSLANLKDIDSDMKYFENIAEKGNFLLEQMQNIEVPENMLDMHKQGLQIVTKAVSLKDEVELDPSDPIGSIISVSEAQNVLVLLIDFQEDVFDRLEEMGIDPSELEI